MMVSTRAKSSSGFLGAADLRRVLSTSGYYFESGVKQKKAPSISNRVGYIVRYRIFRIAIKKSIELTTS